MGEAWATGLGVSYRGGVGSLCSIPRGEAWALGLVLIELCCLGGGVTWGSETALLPLLNAFIPGGFDLLDSRHP